MVKLIRGEVMASGEEPWLKCSFACTAAGNLCMPLDKKCGSLSGPGKPSPTPAPPIGGPFSSSAESSLGHFSRRRIGREGEQKTLSKMKTV